MVWLKMVPTVVKHPNVMVMQIVWLRLIHDQENLIQSTPSVDFPPDNTPSIAYFLVPACNQKIHYNTKYFAAETRSDQHLVACDSFMGVGGEQSCENS